MNDTEIKKLHTSMKSAYERSFLASSPKNFFPSAVGEFSKELILHPLFKNERNIIAEMGQQALAQLIQAKMRTLDEIEITIQLLVTYKEVVPSLSHIIEKYYDIKKRCPKNSHAIINETIYWLKEACKMIKYYPGDHNNILKRLVKLDNKGNILEYIFSPTLVKWCQEMDYHTRTEKSSLYYSFSYLNKLYFFYDIRTRPNKLQGFLEDNHHDAVHYFGIDAKNFDQLFEGQNQADAVALGFDVEECKTHMHRVWEFIEPKLLTPKIKKTINKHKVEAPISQIFDYVYSEKSGRREGVFTDNNKTEENFTGLSASLFNFMLKRKKPIPKDEIADEISDHTSKAKPSEQMRNARRTLNDKLKKYFKEDFIVASKNGIWSVNPLYRQYITLKK
ncbi:MAG: hypothetical protein P4L31_01065 [Candidatus Babeliales bacterium]|nr:hypothetical protein [Candidatus Babeliales bacterium]